MGKRIVGSLLGLGMMALSIGAYLSNEPASKTDNGHIIIAVVFVLGLITLINGLIGKKAVTAVAQAPAVSTTAQALLCPTCQKPISPEFSVCPYCATVLKPKCPNCSKEVSSDFKNCPYCGTSLK